jgi:hypothetical protein
MTDFLKIINTVRQRHSSFEQAEKTIQALVLELEKSLIQETLAQYEIDTSTIVMGSQTYYKALRKEKNYTCMNGLISIERSLYRKISNAPCICPMELQAGIVEGFWTPSVGYHETPT